MRSGALAAVALLASLAWACSGASSSDLFETNTSDSMGTSPSPTATSSSDQNGASQNGGGQNGTNGGGDSGGNGKDAGGGGVDSGTSGDASSGACAGGQVEMEPNDLSSEANVIAGLKACGAIAKSSGKADVDYFTFLLPPTSKNVVVSYMATDRILILVTAGGQTIDITQKNAKPLPVIPGGKYQVEVQGASNSTPSYTLTLLE